MNNTRAGFTLDYYGDYIFKKFNKRTTPDIDKIILKPIKRGKQVKKLYDSYTFLDPYASSICFWFKNGTLKSITDLRISSIRDLENPNMTVKTLNETGTTTQLLEYSILQELNDSSIVINYCEYLFELKKGVGSLVFWSTNSIDWLERESSGIMNTLHVD